MQKIVTMGMLLTLCGCSVSTAMKGRDAPDLQDVHVGADLQSVNQLLGKPEKIVVISNGKRLYVYQIKVGRDASAADFLVNALLDAATAGGWEMVDENDVHKSNYYITYDEQDKVETINTYVALK